MRNINGWSDAITLNAHVKMRSLTISGTVVGLFFLAATGGVMAQTITVFDAPNASQTFAYSINDSGAVAGRFIDNATGTWRGFVRDGNGVFTVFDAPVGLEFDPEEAAPLAINAAGEVTGWFVKLPVYSMHGFIRDRKGVITVFDAPNVCTNCGGWGTTTSSINAAGAVTGTFPDASTGIGRGYLRDQQGNFTVFDAPNAAVTRPQAINAAGMIAGNLGDIITGNSRGFVRNRQGVITVFDAPNAYRTFVRDINAAGTIAGGFVEVGTNAVRGFLRDRRGNFTVFDVPDSSTTQCHAINAAGVCAGQFTREIDGNTGSFVRDRHGRITVFEPSGGWSINANGTVAGSFADAGVTSRGFIRVPTQGANRAQLIVRTDGAIGDGAPCPIPRTSNNYSSIRAAVYCARDGDRIRVARGVFIGQVVIDKYLTIVGQGPNRTVLIGGHPVLGVNAAATVKGVTVSAQPGVGPALDGGLIEIDAPGKRLTIENCWLVNGRASDGGAIKVNASSEVHIKFSVLSNNVAMGGIGGAITNYGVLKIWDSVIVGNTASFGAGIYNRGNLTLSRIVITGNHAASDGGGIFNEGGSVRFWDQPQILANTPTDCVGCP